jgi:ATP-dependent DNA helicase RecG
MTDQELREIVDGLRLIGGDHAEVEAKAARSELPKRLWETLSAFSNTPGGGALILGLDEERRFEACGVQNPRKIQQDLASVCDQMEPALRPHILPHRFEGSVVVVAEVPEIDRALKPCFYKGAGQTNGSFIRVSDGNRKLSQYEVQLLLASRGQPREDEEATDASASDLSPELVRGLLAEVREDSVNLQHLSDDEILQSLKVLASAGRKRSVTIGGLLSMGKYPQRFFPALTAQFVVYPTADVGAASDNGVRFVDNRRFEGPIGSIVEQLLGAMRRHMTRRTMIRGATREDVWQYPETALREAVVNSLVHRDLSSSACGSPVQVQMFPDRLVITNPGGLFGPVTLDSLGTSGVSAARNATLMRLMEEVPGSGGKRPVCENRGSGIGAMLQALRRAGLEPPRFDDRIANFQVTFPNTSLLDDETLLWLEHLGNRDLSDTQRMALALLRHGHVLDNGQYRQSTGVDSRVATRELGDLVARRLVVQVGTRRWATYRLPSRGGLRRDRRAEIVSLLRQRGELGRGEIARALGISDGAARQWLSQLRRDGKVRLTGSPRSPSVKYRVGGAVRKGSPRKRQ